MAIRGSGHVERTAEIDVKHLLEVLRFGVGDRANPEDAGRDHHVVEPAKLIRDLVDASIHARPVANVEAGRASHDFGPGAEARRLIGDGPADAVRPAHDEQPSVIQGGANRRRLIVLERLHLEHSIGQDHVQPSGDLHVHLIARHGEDASARDVAQDEAAVIGRGHVACGGSGLVRLDQD